MERKKPDVLSEDEKLACSLVSKYYTFRQLKNVIDEACIHQIDADVAYYEPLIQQARKDGYDEGVKDRLGLEDAQSQVIKQLKSELQQARTEVARGIFVDVERLWPIPQSLKDKWLKGAK